MLNGVNGGDSYVTYETGIDLLNADPGVTRRDNTMVFIPCLLGPSRQEETRRKPSAAD